MSEPRRKTVIIGPSPSSRGAGGVLTHVRVVSSYAALGDVIVLDPGSLRTQGAWEALREVRALGSALSRERPDAVFYNASIYRGSFLKLILFFLVLPRGLRPRTRVFFHGGSFTRSPFPFLRPVSLLLRLLLRRAAAFYFLTTEQEAGFSLLFPGLSTRRFSNFLDVDVVVPRASRGERPFTLLFVGRLEEEKGVFVLLEAIDRLRREGAGQVRLEVVGEGREAARMRQQAHRLGLEGEVLFRGPLAGDELTLAYRDADLLVLPSFAEGMPYCVLESFQTGLPVLATGVGALEWMIEDGVTGHKVLPRDPVSLAEGIRRFLLDPGMAGGMSRACQKLYRERFSRSAGEAFYRALLSGDGEQEGRP